MPQEPSRERVRLVLLVNNPGLQFEVNSVILWYGCSMIATTDLGDISFSNRMNYVNECNPEINCTIALVVGGHGAAVTYYLQDFE